MTLAEVYGADFSVRKTVWSKRGDTITRRVVDQPVSDDDARPSMAKGQPARGPRAEITITGDADAA